MAVLDDLAVYIAANTALVAGTTLWLGYMPERPNTMVVLHEYTGLSPEWTHDLNPYELPKVQAVCRGEPENWDAVRTQAQALWNLLTRIKNQTINGVYYVSVRALQSPFPLRRDDLARQEWGCNFQVVKAVS